MKAVVMEIRDNDVVLLCDDGSFTRTKNRSYMIGDVIDMKKNTNRIRFVSAAAAAAVEELEIEEVEVDSEAVGYEMVQSAKALSLTPGKYNLITKHLGVTIDESNVEEYRNMPVRDIMKQFTDTKGVQGKEQASDAQNKPDKVNGNSEVAKEKNADKKQARETEQVRVSESAQETAETNRETEQNRITEPSQAGQNAGNSTQAAGQNTPEIGQQTAQGSPSGAGGR